MSLRYGATDLRDGRSRFRVWAPLADELSLHLLSPDDRLLPMQRQPDGIFEVVAEGVGAGSRYFYRLPDGRELPDPASRHQPAGVHGPSQVVTDAFAWSDTNWRGIPLREYVLYELHVGTFTRERTFDAVIPHLARLRDLGITAIELMPVAQFPGERNWGYDGAFPWAVQHSYGGPEGLKKLVNAAHDIGMAVVLDVVYNHLGPEGNYLGAYGHYFTDRYKTPWGTALNFDGPHSSFVREYFVENALQWVEEFHIDALRLDAVHAIIDHSAVPFLQDLAEAVDSAAERLGRNIYTIAESDLNDPRLIRERAAHGFGLSAQWSDDFHHALRVLLAEERHGYYSDFTAVSDLARAINENFAYADRHSSFRGRRHGALAADLPKTRFVVYAQNHDQVGNRMMGERLTTLAHLEQVKLAAGLVVLSPFIPLLFMGEEYGETAPFLYFTSHSDPDLVEAVRKGRREEFAAFAWRGQAPDPDAVATFEDSTLSHSSASHANSGQLADYYRNLLELRRSYSALGPGDRSRSEAIAFDQQKVLLVRRWSIHDEFAIVVNFSDQQADLVLPLPAARWTLFFSSRDARWGGDGQSVTSEIAAKSAPVTIPPFTMLIFVRMAEESS